MALSNDDQAKIRDYLLGNLSDEHQQQLEERLMTEDDLFEEYEIAKGELIEEYRGGELTPKEHRWFELNYLASPEGKHRYTFVAALECLERPTPAPQPPSLFERFLTFIKTSGWAIPTAATAALAVVIAIGLFGQLTPQTSFAVTLRNSALTRGPSDDNSLPVKFTLPANTGEVKASLPLPRSFPPQTTFRALLDNRTEKTAVKIDGYTDRVVTVVIPAKQLPHGEYALELTAILANGTEEAIPGDYRFVVD